MCIYEVCPESSRTRSEFKEAGVKYQIKLHNHKLAFFINNSVKIHKVWLNNKLSVGILPRMPMHTRGRYRRHNATTLRPRLGR